MTEHDALWYAIGVASGAMLTLIVYLVLRALILA